VSAVACSHDESNVAVASTRGNVSIYRLSPSVHFHVESNTRPTGSNMDLYSTLHSITQHAGSAVKELHWSLQGKYLYVGDSAGMLTQTDVSEKLSV